MSSFGGDFFFLDSLNGGCLPTKKNNIRSVLSYSKWTYNIHVIHKEAQCFNLSKNMYDAIDICIT